MCTHTYVSVHIQTEASAAGNRGLQFRWTATRCSHTTLQNWKFWPQDYRNLFWNMYDCRTLTKTLMVFNPEYQCVKKKPNIIWAKYSIFLLSSFVPKYSIANVNRNLRNQSRIGFVYFHSCCHRSWLELTILYYTVFCFLHKRERRNEALVPKRPPKDRIM